MNGTSTIGALFMFLTVLVVWYLVMGHPRKPFFVQRFIVRRQRKKECPCCHGTPVIWIDVCDNKYHAVLYDCAGYHEPLCIEHDEQWWRIFELERELLR